MKSIFLPVLFFSVAYGSGVLETYLTAYNSNVGKNCDESLSDLEVLSCDVTPWPPVRKSELYMQMKGTIHRDLTTQSIDVAVTYNGIDFYHTSFPQTNKYEDGDTAELAVKVYLPIIAPGGKYEVKIRVKDDSEQYLNCWEVDFSL